MAAISHLTRNTKLTDASSPKSQPIPTLARIPISKLLTQRTRFHNQQPHHIILPTVSLSVPFADYNDDEEHLFSMLADEIAVPSWLTPLNEEFPKSAVGFEHWTTSPLVERFQPRVPGSVSSLDSDLSSSDDDSESDAGSEGSSTFSDASSELSTPSSTFSPTHFVTPRITITPPPSSSATQPRRTFLITRRERALINTTRTKVEEYDMGKVGVLTGGVMLGGGAKPKDKPTPTPAKKNLLEVPSWRRTATPTPAPTEVKVGRLTMPAWRRGARN